MSEAPVNRIVIVTDPVGVHVRTAAAVSRIVRQGQSKVTLWKDPYHRVDGRDVLQILSLGAPCGSEIHLEATGPDADAILESLIPVFADYESEKKPDRIT